MLKEITRQQCEKDSCGDENGNEQHDEDDGLENTDIVDEIVTAVDYGNTDVDIELMLSDVK